MKKLTIAALLMLSSCTTNDAFKAYVIADRAEFEVTKAHYPAVMEKANMAPHDIATHMGRLDARESHIHEAEKLLKIKE